MENDHLESPIAWRECGDGPAVVFLHGLGGGRGAWGPQLSGLFDRFRCIAWDMPGYGGSDPAEPLTFAAIADRLVGLLDHLQLAKAHLVGLSFGGMHALHTAIAHPDRVDCLVLADTSPAFGMDGTDPDEWRRARLAPLADGLSLRDLAPLVLDAIAGRPIEPGIRDELIEAFGSISAAGFRAAVDCLPTNDVRLALPLVMHQALVIVGDLDTETPLSYAQVLAEGLPNAELVVMGGVGHLTPSEDPVVFNRLVGQFLAAQAEP